MDRKQNKTLVPFAKELRKNMTKEEKHLWYDFLREYPIKFKRQQILGKYIVDFYCAKAKLVIELDGSQHFETQKEKEDFARTEYLKAFGLQVVRIANFEINKNFKSVCEYIDYLVRQAV